MCDHIHNASWDLVREVYFLVGGCFFIQFSDTIMCALLILAIRSSSLKWYKIYLKFLGLLIFLSALNNLSLSPISLVEIQATNENNNNSIILKGTTRIRIDLAGNKQVTILMAYQEIIQQWKWEIFRVSSHSFT